MNQTTEQRMIIPSAAWWTISHLQVLDASPSQKQLKRLWYACFLNAFKHGWTFVNRCIPHPLRPHKPVKFIAWTQSSRSGSLVSRYAHLSSSPQQDLQTKIDQVMRCCSMKDTVRHIPSRVDKANIPSTFTGILWYLKNPNWSTRLPSPTVDFPTCPANHVRWVGSINQTRFIAQAEVWRLLPPAMGINFMCHGHQGIFVEASASLRSLMIKSDGQGGPELKC